MSDLVKEGFTQGGILPSILILDIAADTSIRPLDTVGDESWLDVVANPTHIVDLALPTAVETVLNEAPPKYSLTADKVNLLVPGVYTASMNLEIICQIAGAAEFGFGCVEVATAPHDIYYSYDSSGMAAITDFSLNEVRPIVRDFLIDISVPKTIALVFVERNSSSAQFKVLGGQLKLQRISKYAAVARA